MCIVTKLAQILCLAQKIEIAPHQLRIPERLKALLVERQSFTNGFLAILHDRLGLHGEDLIVGKLLAIVADQLSGRRVLLLRNQEFQETSVQRLLRGIACNPGPILGDRNFFRKTLILNQGEDSLERLPASLLTTGRQLFRRDRRRRRYQGKY